MKARDLFEGGMIQWRIVVTLCAILIGFGAYAFLTMPRQEFPDFTIRQGLVVGVMPGATSKEVEERLTRPLEDYLFAYNEVNKKKTYSVSREGQVVVYVQLRDEVEGEEAPAFWAKLRHGLNELKAQALPAQVLALIGNNDFGDTSAVLFTVSAPGRSPRDLAKYVEVLQSHLRRIDATAKLRTYGAQQEVLRVSISRERLARYGVRPASVWASLQGLGGAPTPARLDTDQLELPVRVDRVLTSEAELGDTVLLSLPLGPMVRLKDVADIHREYGHDDAMVRFNGQTAMVLSIEMKSGHDITRFGDEIDRAMDEARAELPTGVTLARVADQPQVVRTSVGHFLRDFGLAILSVIVVTMLLLPLRVAAVAAVSIPVTIAITLAVLNSLGVQLQTVSLAGLIVVLGMVVDNAIVVIDDHVDKLDRGLDPWSAAWKSARDLALPVLTATAAIILSYVPMPLLLTGLAKDFVGSLPVTITVALITSMLVALFLVPVMNWRFIRRGLHRASGRPSLLELLQRGFDRALEAAFRHPFATVLGGAAAVALALYLASTIPQQMFPKVDRNQFAVEVYLPNGRGLEQTDAVIRRLEADLLADPRVTNVTAFVGQGSPRFHTVYAPHMPGRNYGQLLVNTQDDEATVAVLRDHRRDTAGAFPEAWVKWKQLEMTFGTPVEVRLSGDDPVELHRLAALIEAYARTLAGATWVRDDFEEPLEAIRVTTDTDECARLGIPPAMVQASLALGTQGLPLGTIWEDEVPIRVLLKDESDAATSLEGLRQQTVSSALTAAAVPLEQVATLSPAWTEGALVRRNGVRTLTVAVDLAPGALAVNLQRDIEAYVSTLDLGGVRVEYGGEKEMADEIFTPMTVSMGVSVGLIFLVMLLQFQRFRKVLVIMTGMPLSLLGAFLGLVAAGYPFGLTAFIGIIGLLGIVVRNGVILVTYAEELRRGQGMSARDAALAAGKRRMRPIYLTSMAAAIGVVPMILSRSTLWGPLGTVTCFGLLVAMVLTLFVLPVAYALVVRDDRVRLGPPAGVTLTVILAAILFVHPGSTLAQEGPFSLAACQELALANNARLHQADLEIRAAEETRAAAYTRYFPSVSASATALQAAKPLVEMHTAGGDLPVYNGDPANLANASQFAYLPSGAMSVAERTTMLSASAVQPIYAGGRVQNGNRLAALGVDVARTQAALAQREVQAATDEKYWLLVTLTEKLRTLEAYQQLLGAIEIQVRDGLRAGLLTRNDLLKVTLKRSEVAIDRQRLESGLRLVARDLRHHIGLPDGDAFLLADGLDVPSDPSSLADARQGAVTRRPELQLLALAADAEHLQRELARGEMLPTVSVGGAVFRLDVKGLPGSTNALIFGTLNVPLTAFWEAGHTIGSHEWREQAARERLADTRELVDLEIDKTWSDLQSAWSALRVADEAVEQADVNLAEETDRQVNGLVTFSDVLEAQVLRQQALDHRVDARGDYWLKRSAYLRAVAESDTPGATTAKESEP